MTRTKRNHSADATTGTAGGVRGLIGSAVRDVVDDGSRVLEDETSRTTVEDAFEAVTDPTQRRAFRDALAEIDASELLDETSQAVVTSIVDSVYYELRDSGVRATVTHRTATRFDGRDVALYEFSRTRNPTALASLSLTSAVSDAVVRGGKRVMDGGLDAARDAFETAMDRAETDDDAVVSAVLSAWTNHWRGDDEKAQKLIEDALQRDPDAWPARLAGAVVDHKSPELFREEALSIAAYLRIRTSMPPNSSLRAFVSYDDEGWQELSGEPRYLRLPRLGRETAIRIRTNGPIDALPPVWAYYLAVGVVDERNETPRSVEYQPLSGPVTAEATESLRFEPPE